MRWPWSKPEERQSGGGYTDAIVAAIEAQASAKVADVSSTAAIEAAAGALSRAFMAAAVDAPSWVQEAVSPVWLAQVGRSLIREGASLSVIVMGDKIELVPASFWNFENTNPGAQEGEIEESWRARVSTYGPSTSYTRLVSRERLVFLRWGSSPGLRHQGRGPTSWAHTTARLQGEAERSLADEAGGPVANLIPTPEGVDVDSDDDTDPWAAVRAGLKAARGGAVLVETVATGGGDGPAAAPRRDWEPRRLGPAPPDAMVAIAQAAFSRMLAACGIPPQLLDPAAPATAIKEANRLFHLGTVTPLARLLEHELSRPPRCQGQAGLRQLSERSGCEVHRVREADGRGGDDRRKSPGHRWADRGRRMTARICRPPSTRTCDIEGCDNRHMGLGMCAKHHRRWYTTGDPLTPLRKVPFSAAEDERILALPTNRNGRILHKALEDLALVLGRRKTVIGNRRRLLLRAD